MPITFASSLFPWRVQNQEIQIGNYYLDLCSEISKFYNYRKQRRQSNGFSSYINNVGQFLWWN